MSNKLNHNVLLVLVDERTGRRRRIAGRNIVTAAGNVWYAQRAAGESPANDFNTLYLANTGPNPPGSNDNYGSFAVIVGSGKLVKAGYPKTNDTDADNAEAGPTRVSWLFSYAATEGPFAKWYLS